MQPFVYLFFERKLPLQLINSPCVHFPATTDIKNSRHKGFHAALLSSLPDDFWSYLRTSSVVWSSNKRFSITLMCYTFCFFSQLLCTIALNYDSSDVALLFESSLRQLRLQEDCQLGREMPSIMLELFFTAGKLTVCFQFK